MSSSLWCYYVIDVGMYCYWDSVTIWNGDSCLYRSVSQQLRKGFHIEFKLNAIGRKHMTQGVEVNWRQFSVFEDSRKAILQCAWFHRFFFSRHQKGRAAFDMLLQNLSHIFWNRNGSLRAFSFGFCQNQLCFCKSIYTLNPLNGFFDGQNPFFQINIFPLQSTQFSNANSSLPRQEERSRTRGLQSLSLRSIRSLKRSKRFWRIKSVCNGLLPR